jgi:hypothetical protein
VIRAAVFISAALLATSAAVAAARDDETVRCLAADPPEAVLPTWWPRGESIAVAVPRGQAGAIVRAGPAAFGFWTVQVNRDGAPVKLVWSPDGEIIAFQTRTGAIAISGTGRLSWNEEIVHPEDGTSTELGDWSPDSTQLVFSRDRRIYTVHVQTKEIRKVGDGVHPTWSPDGKEIAFAESPRTLAVVRPDGSGRRVLVDDAAVESIAWAPDSSELAFVGEVLGIVSRAGGRVVYTEAAEPPIAWRSSGIFYNHSAATRFDPETDTTVELMHLPPGFNGRFAAASANGELIAYDLEVDSMHAGVRVVDARGHNDEPLLACHGTKHEDRVTGSRLNDVIRVLGGGRDHVRCGGGRDLVYADRRDTVARDCERVLTP